MTIITTGRLQASEASDRQRAALAVKSDGTQLGTLQGYISGLTLTKTAGLGWSLDLGRAVIAPATAANGPVIATIIAAETGAWAPGDATRDRIDIMTLLIDETATLANGNPPVKVNIIQGAYPAAGSPVAPTVPAGQLPLWQEYIAAGTSAGTGWDTTKLTDLRQQLVGGLAPVNPAVPLAMATGVQSITMVTTANYVSVSVPLPAGVFTAAPKIAVTASSAPGGVAGKVNAHTSGKSATSFTLTAFTGDGVNPAAGVTITFDWIAVQMTPAG